MTAGLRSAVQVGLLGALVAWHASLVGMIETFHDRRLIGEAVTLGYVWLAGIVILTAYFAARHKAPPMALLSGGIAGGIIGLSLVILAVLISIFDLRDVLNAATPDLAELITFNLEVTNPLGDLLPIVIGAVVGGAAGGLTRLPGTWQRTIATALVVTIMIALLRDIFVALLPDGVGRFFFTSRGMTIAGAFFLLIVAGVLVWVLASYGLPGVRLPADDATGTGHIESPWRIVYLALGAAFLLTFPLWSGRFLSNVADFVGLYIIMGLGLSLVIGFAGMLDLGYVAFYAIGAYTMALLTSPEVNPVPWSFWAALPVSMLTAFLAGVLLGLPVLRMRGDYLAIATLGFGEIIRILALSESLTDYMGGAQGITRIASPQIGTWVFDSPERIYYLVLIGCVIAWFVAARLKTSRLGRAWMAIREDEDVAQAMGINRVTAKLLAFAIGALLGGMSGAIFASFVGSVVPLSFGLLVSINVLALIIVGGMGSLPGVLVGALVLVGLPELLREFSEYRLLVYGAVLVVMMLFRPEGLWPEATRRRELHKETVPLPETTEPVTTATSVSTSTSSVKD
ncbi:MAG: branched-chain amino acid ABC transporter permease [Chloroflexaceae bacterium]